MDDSPRAIARAEFLECRSVHEFLNVRMRPRIAAAAGGDEAADPFYVSFHRVVAWLRTLWKLNEPADFQAVTTASRSLFEIAVDLTVMHLDSAANPPEKMMAWEESAKVKAAARIRDFVRRDGCGLAETDFLLQFSYLSSNEQRIKDLRKQWWPRKDGRSEHPDRWTRRTLPEDADNATKLYPTGKFDEYIAVRYPQICWNTHGSGGAGVRGISVEVFPALAAIAFKECAHFALIAAEMTLRHFDLWDKGIPAADEFQAFGEDRILAKAGALGMTLADLDLSQLRGGK